MKKVHVWSHKDGDYLVIVEHPWWSDIYEWLVTKLYCPCHGLSGWIANHVEWYELYTYNVWNVLLNVPFRLRLEKELFKIPIESSCLANQQIFGKMLPCWRTNCDHCWHLSDDAFKVKY